MSGNEKQNHPILKLISHFFNFFEIFFKDLGNYSCQAENTQGVARDHIELSGN